MREFHAPCVEFTHSGMSEVRIHPMFGGKTPWKSDGRRPVQSYSRPAGGTSAACGTFFANARKVKIKNSTWN